MKLFNLKLLCLFLFFFSGSYALAETTLVSVSGASNFDPTDPKAIKIYGGHIDNLIVPASCTQDNLNTCNTCQGAAACGGDPFCPCNEQGIYSSLILRLTFNTTVDLTNRTILVKRENGTTDITGVTKDKTTNTFSVYTTWGNWCAGGGVSSCTEDWTLSFSVGPSASGSTSEFESTEKIDVHIYVRYIDQMSGAQQYTSACPTLVGDAGKGFCWFKAFRGDEKVYLDDPGIASDYPTASSRFAEIKYNHIRFYHAYSQLDAGTVSNSAIIDSISNASPSFSIEVLGDTSEVAFDEKITGLENDLRYCFITANEDIAGNIYYYMNPADAKANDSNFCAIPSAVEGLLDDKNCFIATAAFGSKLNPYVDTLRQFRSKFLAPYDWGQKVIKFYYDVSPKWAKKIAKNENLKSAARIVLWPAVGFASLSLKWGLIPTLMLVVSVLLAVGAGLRWRRKRIHNH